MFHYPTALKRLIDSPELRTQYARTGRETIVRDFSFERRMQKMAAVYDELLSQNTS